jgi:outer membrane protein TolC
MWSLTGGLGTQSANFGVNQGSHIWAFGPSVYWPVLDFGALDALVNVADLQTHERLIAYRKTVIDAVQDADSAIADFTCRAAASEGPAACDGGKRARR